MEPRPAGARSTEAGGGDEGEGRLGCEGLGCSGRSDRKQAFVVWRLHSPLRRREAGKKKPAGCRTSMGLAHELRNLDAEQPPTEASLADPP